MVPARPFFSRKPGWVRSRAWIWLFSSTETFTWTANPDKIIAAVNRGRQALESILLRSGREASLFALRSTPCRGQNENLTRRAPHCRAQLVRDDAGRRVSSGHVMGVARDSDPLRIGRAYRHDPRGHPRLLGCARPGGAARSDRRDNAGCRSSRPLLNSDDPGRSGHALHARGRPVAPYAPRLCERRATAGRAKSPQGGWHMIRLLPFPLAAAGLFALWLLLSQAFSLGHVLVGGALSLI